MARMTRQILKEAALLRVSLQIGRGLWQLKVTPWVIFELLLITSLLRWNRHEQCDIIVSDSVGMPIARKESYIDRKSGTNRKFVQRTLMPATWVVNDKYDRRCCVPGAELRHAGF
jgi:hypothetical protein